MSEYYVSCDRMKELERATDASGLSYYQMMENAGTIAANRIVEITMATRRRPHPSEGQVNVRVYCGKGNNGGDGFVIARLLHEHFPLMRIHVVLVCGAPTASPAVQMYELLQADDTLSVTVLNESDDYNTVMPPCDVTVDAVYGIGFRGALSDIVATVFDHVQAHRSYTVAVDIPSGMLADAERFDAHLLKANATVTFTAEKPCVILPKTALYCGHITVADVGIPKELISRYAFEPHKLTDADVQSGLPIRFADSHKGTYGHAVALCGSYGMAGAAMLAGKAALRMGAGLVHMCIPESIYPIVAGNLWEAVCHPLGETLDGGLAASASKTVSAVLKGAGEKRCALLVGPGLSTHRRTAALLAKWLPETEVPMVIDADGLNCLSLHIDVMKAISHRSAVRIITPHPAEAARLLGCSIADVESDRFGAARKLASLCSGIAVLKGYRTVIASQDGLVCFNTTACSGLATGGSGDVLAGMIVSLLAQGVHPMRAACAAVYLHGFAAVRVSERLSETGMLPSDLLEELPVLLSQFEKRE